MNRFFLTTAELYYLFKKSMRILQTMTGQSITRFATGLARGVTLSGSEESRLGKEILRLCEAPAQNDRRRLKRKCWGRECRMADNEGLTDNSQIAS
jgi:hypothetical protein